jgi:hypothetical protein
VKDEADGLPKGWNVLGQHLLIAKTINSMPIPILKSAVDK